MNEQGELDFTGPVHTGKNHPDTSRKAANRVSEKVVRLRREVITVIKEAGSRGLTAAEVATLLGKDKNSTSPRITELKNYGMIRDSGWRRPTPPVGSSIIWLYGDIEPGDQIIFDETTKRKV